jgi:3-(3-hydroxy-phenyl)propionate hydroxylase
MAAIRCVQRGLRVVAIDRSTEIYPLPRAIGMDEEIQRVFQNAGLEQQLRKVSTPLQGAEFVDAVGNRLVGIDIPSGTLGPSGYPPMAMFDQPGLERAARQEAATVGVQFELGVEAKAITTTGDGVSVTVADAGDDSSTREMHSRWLIGADGGSSTVRRLAGVELVDQGYDEEWLVVDTTLLDPDCDLPHVAQQVCDPDRVITFVPGHDTRRRWEIKLKDDDCRDEVSTDDRIARFLRPWADPEQLGIDRTAVYRFHALVAETFRRGPVFLAGDSAHQMPPFNGQGMNTGIRDADNLAWKLALVADGVAGEGLLDTYDAERRPHAAGQVEHSADAGRLIEVLASGGTAATDAGYGGGRPFPHLEHGLVFGDHPSVGHPLPQPTVDGTRLDDLLGPGFALIGEPTAVTDETEAVWNRLAANHLTVDHPAIAAIHADDEIIVVRPDRYVAAVTRDLDDVTSRLERTLRP